MPIPIDALEILNREFLGIRAKLLEVAASIDRMTRADGSVEDDPRWHQLLDAMKLIREEKSERAEKMQMFFSLPYEETWQKDFGMENPADVA